MNDDELRLLIRSAIQKHMGTGAGVSVAQVVETIRQTSESSPSMSFSQYRIDRSAGDSMCIIEPAVQCNHCGFCKCHGH